MVKGGIASVAVARFVACAACVALAACSLALGEGEFVGGTASDAGTDTDATTPSTDADGTASDAAIDTSDGAVEPKPDPDLLGWWKLDETSGTIANDSSQYANEGHFVGAPVWTNTGKRNGAILFNGASFVDVSNHPSLVVSTKLTIAFWVRVDIEVDDARVFLYGGGFNVKLNNRHPQLEMTAGYAVAMPTVPNGEWHHVAFTFDGGITAAYYDGFSVGLEANTLSAGASVPATGDDLRIGGTLDDTYALKGAVDDVRYYRRVLSAAEVDALTK